MNKWGFLQAHMKSRDMGFSEVFLKERYRNSWGVPPETRKHHSLHIPFYPMISQHVGVSIVIVGVPQ